MVGLPVIVRSVSVGGKSGSSMRARTRIWTEVNVRPRFLGDEQARSKGRQTKTQNRTAKTENGKNSAIFGKNNGIPSKGEDMTSASERRKTQVR